MFFFKNKLAKQIIFFIFGLILSLNHSFSINVFPECNNKEGINKFYCNSNKILTDNFQTLHTIYKQVLIKNPTKKEEIRKSINQLFLIIKNNGILETTKICNYFIKNSNCNNANIKIENFNLEDKIEIGNLGKKTGGDTNEKIRKILKVLKKIENFKKDTIEGIGFFLDKKNKTSFINILIGYESIEQGVESISKPSENNKDKIQGEKYKIGLLKIFEPFLYFNTDFFISFGGRTYYNPVITFGVIWYLFIIKILYLFLITIFIIAFFYPIVNKDGEYKRKTIFVVATESDDFSFFSYLKSILFSNKGIYLYNVEGEEYKIVNDFNTPLIFKFIIKDDKISFSLNFILWFMLILIIQFLSGYLF